jgi:hypothetical protein
VSKQKLTLLNTIVFPSRTFAAFALNAFKAARRAAQGSHPSLNPLCTPQSDIEVSPIRLAGGTANFHI